jgi:hypothetical protein
LHQEDSNLLEDIIQRAYDAKHIPGGERTDKERNEFDHLHVRDWNYLHYDIDWAYKDARILDREKPEQNPERLL